MKKYIILFFVLSFNLFSYEIQFYGRNVSGAGAWREGYFFDNNNEILSIRYVYNGQPDAILYDTASFYRRLGYIKSNTVDYITSEVLNNFFKEENQALNDFYIQQRQPFLNFLYNENEFNSTNYIQYDNYELLYNSDGLVVESIVDGIWAGLYSEGEKNISGNLYDEKGELKYINGLETNQYQKWFAKFGFSKLMENSLSVYGYGFLGVMLICLFVILIERFTDFSLISIIGRLGK